MLERQKSIEQVGWKCQRVDVLSFLSDHRKILIMVEGFLASVGVDEADGGIVKMEPGTEEVKPNNDMMKIAQLKAI
jgi:hypothetical protein